MKVRLNEEEIGERMEKRVGYDGRIGLGKVALIPRRVALP